MKDLSIIQKRELMYLAMLVLAKGDNHILPELLEILDCNSVQKIINVLGGKYIRIPTSDEMLKAINTILYYYNIEILGKDIDEVKTTFKVNGYEHRWIMKRIEDLKDYMKNNKYKIPEEFRKSKILRELNEKLWNQ